MEEIRLVPIGKVESTRSEMIDDDWDKENASIVIDAAFGLKLLSDFLIFLMLKWLFISTKLISQRSQRVQGIQEITLIGRKLVFLPKEVRTDRTV